MTLKYLGLATAIALCPGVTLAQTNQKQPPPDRARHPTAITTTTSAGEVSAAVPQSAIDEQKNPRLIGTPAWWSARATADGKPATAEGPRRNP
jgi:hypothetical protein